MWIWMYGGGEEEKDGWGQRGQTGYVIVSSDITSFLTTCFHDSCEYHGSVTRNIP